MDEQEKKWALKLTVAATVNLMMAQVSPVTGDTHDKKVS